MYKRQDRARLRVTPRHLAYLKVSEGCDRLCTFCAIPYMRGKHVTKPIEQVLDEARELDADGVRAFATGRLAHYKIPRYVRIVDEFPMTVTGKIRKVQMREEAARSLGLG